MNSNPHRKVLNAPNSINTTPTKSNGKPATPLQPFRGNRFPLCVLHNIRIVDGLPQGSR